MSKSNFLRKISNLLYAASEYVNDFAISPDVSYTAYAGEYSKKCVAPAVRDIGQMTKDNYFTGENFFDVLTVEFILRTYEAYPGIHNRDLAEKCYCDVEDLLVILEANNVR